MKNLILSFINHLGRVVYFGASDSIYENVFFIFT